MAASQVIVVHGRQVVVYQRERVNEFDCGRRRIEFVRFDAETFAARVDEMGPNAFTARQDRIAHGFVQSARSGIDRG